MAGAKWPSVPTQVRGLDAHVQFSADLYGDNFCDFMFASIHTKPILKKGLFLKERICSQTFASFGSKFFPIIVDPFPKWRQKHF